MTEKDVRVERLGKVFSKENLEQLHSALDKLELPTIPQDVTLGEARELLAYHGNMLAFLHANARVKESSVRNAKSKYDTIYNQIYKRVHDTNRNLKATELKNIVQNSPDVIEAQNASLDAQYELSVLEANIDALSEQNVNLRKIVSIMQASAETKIS